MGFWIKGQGLRFSQSRGTPGTYWEKGLASLCVRDCIEVVLRDSPVFWESCVVRSVRSCKFASRGFGPKQQARWEPNWDAWSREPPLQQHYSHGSYLGIMLSRIYCYVQDDAFRPAVSCMLQHCKPAMPKERRKYPNRDSIYIALSHENFE